MPRAQPRRNDAGRRRLALERGDADTGAQIRLRSGGRAGGRPAGADRQGCFRCAGRNAVRAINGLGTTDGRLNQTRALGRREFIGGLSAVLLAPSARAQADIARVSVDYENGGHPIAPDFIGLSYESAILNPGTYFAPDNATLLALLRALGSAGVLRIGGNTSERTVSGPAGAAVPDGIVITPAAIDRLAATLRALGWKLIYGLNLARGTPEAAAEEAAYVARALGPLLLASQIGNEPDSFGRWTRVRPPSYDVAAFLVEWMRFAAAIRARVPEAAFAGPD